MTSNTPSGAKKHRESTEPESHQTAKMFSFFFFFFRWASSNLRDSFTMVFAQNSSIFHWAVHQTIAFFQVWSHTVWHECINVIGSGRGNSKIFRCTSCACGWTPFPKLLDPPLTLFNFPAPSNSNYLPIYWHTLKKFGHPEWLPFYQHMINYISHL